MTQGLERRAQPQDGLRGAEAVNPVTRQVPGVSAPSTPSVPDNSFSARIAQQVGRFAQGQLAEIQRERQNRSVLDGQISAMQGESFESVEMEGDKWALEGYRLVTAQTMGASLLRAQEHEINNGGYESEPEAYRATLVDRIDGMTREIPDERTRTLVRDNLLQQMPGLIDLHTRKHLGFKEQQNFDSLAQSVDVLSRDNSSTGALIAFAMGETDATAGLSIERRRAAVVQGVVNAFQNNNPAAYAHLEAAGFINTENLTAGQVQQLRQAQNSYEARLRQQWNAEFTADMAALNDDVKAGKVNPIQAAERQAKIFASHGMNMRASEGAGIYERARAGVQIAEGTRGLNIQAAGVAGDYDLQARLLQEAVIHQESRGNPNAVSPVGAVGLMQLMPGTARSPGFGVRNIFRVAEDMGYDVPDFTDATMQMLMRQPDINAAMGTEYLTKMLQRYRGNVEKALVAYNWGAGNADKWNGDRATLPKETQGYLKNILGSIADDRPDPQAERIAAERNLENARKQAGLRVLEEMGPAMAENDELFSRGLRTVEDWRAQRREMYEAWGVELDSQRVNQEQQMMRAVAGDRLQALQEQTAFVEATNAAVILETSIAQAEMQLDERRAAFEAGTSDMTLDQINEEYLGSIMQAYRASGSELDPGRISAFAGDLVTETRDLVRNAMAAQEERAIINNADTAGTVGTLPDNLKDKAVGEFREELSKSVQNFQAENPDATPEEVGAYARQAEIEYLSRNNIVDDRIRQQINLAASGRWTDAKGEPRPTAAVGVHSFLSMYAENPELAYQYVPDPVARGRMLAAAHMLQTQFPDHDVFTQVDMTDRDNPITNAIYDTVQQVGLGADNPPSAEESANRVNDALNLIATGNITNTVGGWILQDGASQALIPQSMLDAGLSSEFDIEDVNAARSVNNAAIDEQFSAEVRRFIEEIVPHMPNTSHDGAITMALDYVRTRGALMGSTYMMPKANQPSIRAQMFPGQTGVSTAAVNTAVVEWMMAEDTNNPILQEMQEDQGTFSSNPDFTVSRINGTYVLHLVGYGSVPMDLKSIGDRYVANR